QPRTPSSTFHVETASSPPARLCAGYVSLLVDGAPSLGRPCPASWREDQGADELAHGAAARALLRRGIRRVAARGEGGELAGRREPGEADHEQRQWRVADGEELDDVPRRIPAEPVVGGKRPDEITRPQKAGQEDACAQSRVTGLHLREPEPRMQRGQDEDERERVRRRQQKPDDAEREQRAAVPSEPFLRPDRPPRQETAACDEPACSGEQD